MSMFDYEKLSIKDFKRDKQALSIAVSLERGSYKDFRGLRISRLADEIIVYKPFEVIIHKEDKITLRIPLADIKRYLAGERDSL